LFVVQQPGRPTTLTLTKMGAGTLTVAGTHLSGGLAAIAGRVLSAGVSARSIHHRRLDGDRGTRRFQPFTIRRTLTLNGGTLLDRCFSEDLGILTWRKCRDFVD